MSRQQVWRSTTGVWLFRVWSGGREVGFGSADSETEARRKADALAVGYEEPEPLHFAGGIWGIDAVSGAGEQYPDDEEVEVPADFAAFFNTIDERRTNE